VLGGVWWGSCGLSRAAPLPAPAAPTSREYDRLMTEHERLQKTSGETGDKKSD